MKMKKRTFLFLSVLFSAFILLCPMALAADNIKITVDGKNIAFTDAVPFIDQNGRTQVPMRALGEALGCNVDYVKTTQPNGFFDTRIFVSKKNTDGKLWQAEFIGPNYDIDGHINRWQKQMSLTIETPVVRYPNTYKEVSMDTAPTEINSRTYLPARYIAEAFGYNVLWDAKNNAVIITGNAEAIFNERPYQLSENPMFGIYGNWSLINNQTNEGSSIKITNDTVVYRTEQKSYEYQITDIKFDKNTASYSLNLQKGNISTVLNLIIYGYGDHAVCFHRMEPNQEFYGTSSFTAYYISQDEDC